MAALIFTGIASGAMGDEAAPNAATDADHFKDAKGLFFEQLTKPTQSINLGLTYWIERVRKGKTDRVSNKTPFFSGDQIKFHVKSNIDGYAYILLKSGSRGEQSVLFPDEKSKEDNHIERGRDYELPADGLITFDKHPGTEQLTLLLSRQKLDASAYLAKPHEKATYIASSSVGSKDFVPVHVAVAFGAEPDVNWDKAPKESSDAKIQLASLPPGEKKVKPTNSAKKSDASATIKKTQAPVVASKSHSGNNSVTIVKKDPGGILHIDIALDHRS